MRCWPVHQVVSPLRFRNDLLRFLAISLLALMLVLPAAVTLIDSLATGRSEVDGVRGTDEDVGASGTDDIFRFWATGGTHDVIVIFKDPCVVERRVSMETSGQSSPDALTTASREYKRVLDERHGSFERALTSEFREARVTREFTTVLNGMAISASPEALDWVAEHPSVRTVEPDYEVEAALSNSVPLINADDLWSTKNASGSNITGKGIVVAVLDTGINWSHPDLGGTGVMATDYSSYTSGTHARIVGGWNTINDTDWVWDGHYHGTHCAGIVGMNGTVKGVAPDCDFLIYKVLGDSGSGPSSAVIGGVELAADPDDDGDTSDHADVISMSLSGGGHPTDGKSTAVNNAVDAGAVVAVAASNKGPRYETQRSPSEAAKAIGVGATSKSDTLASFSSRGPSAVYTIKPDVTAPGVSIYSTATAPYNGYRTISGTSMATPHVAGSAALLIQSHPSWTPYRVKQALMGTAKDVGYNVYQQGAGRIDASLAESTPVVADPPSVSLGRLSAISNVTEFTITFENLASGWTNGTLSWELRWELTNLYGASGSTTDLSGMIKANTTVVNMTGGSKFTVKLSVSYDSTSNVGHHLGEVRLTTPGGPIRVPIAFYVRAPILLVDDDNTDWTTNPPYNNHNPYTSGTVWYQDLDSSKRFGDAMVDLNLAFDVFTTRWYFDGPTKDEMANYRVVVWNTGFDYGYYGRTLTSNDRSAIKGFVDGGGNLWMSSSFALYDIYGANNETSLPATDFARAVFGVGGFQRHSGTPDPMAGTTGTFMAGASYDIDVVAFNTADHADMDYGQNLTPVDGAYQLTAGSATDYWGASWSNITSSIARDSGSNKTLLTAFEFAHIRTASDRKDMVDRVLKWVDLRPHGAISVSGEYKEGSEVTFSGRVTDPRATEVYSFEWDLDYRASTFTKDATGSSIAHTYVDDGNYTVALRVRETRTGSVSPLVLQPVDVINQAPEAHLRTSSPGDEAAPVSFWGNATDPGTSDTFTWEWDFDYDGVTFTVDSTSQDTTHTYLDDGTYTAALRVTDDEGLTSPINTTDVVIRNLPPEGNIFTPGTSNEGDKVPFTATVSDPSPQDTVTVRWDFQYNGRTFNEMANGTVVNHTYRDDGTYTVLMRLTDEDGGLSNISLQIVVRNVDPVPDFTHSAPADEGSVVDFNGTVTDAGEVDIHTFEWDFMYIDENFTVDSSRKNASWQYSQDGTYTVALRVRDDDGGMGIVTKEVVIRNVAPAPTIEEVDDIDEGQALTFRCLENDPGIHDVFTYLWDFGDGSNSTRREPRHTFLDDGTFTVTVTVTDDAGGRGQTSLDVNVINVDPNATVALTPSHINENGTVYFQADGKDASPLDEANLSYTWNFGDGDTSNLRQVSHVYMDDGCFTVTLTVQDDDGGVTVYTYHVQVDNVAPSVIARADREYVKEGGTVNFTAQIEDPGPLDTHTVSWDFDDGSSSDELKATHRFLDDGNYIVVLTVTDNSGGTNTTTFRVSVSNVRPVLTATVNTTETDEGGSVSFSASWTDPGELDDHTILWDFGDGTNVTDPSGTHVFVQDGTYTVLVTVTDDDGGQASKPFIIEVSNVPPVPVITVSTTTIDESGTVLFSASSTDEGALDNVTYYWTLGDGTTSNQVSLSHTYNDNGVFRVTLRADDGDGGISTPKTVTITVNNVPPEVTATSDVSQTTIGKGVNFAASATDVSPEDTVSFSWNFGDFVTSDLERVTHVYTIPGRFNVTLIATDDDGGQAFWQTVIVVKPDLDGDAIPDDEDDDIDGDGYKNSEDDYPRDPDRYKDWRSIYLLLLLIVVVAAAVGAYIMRPKS